MTEQEELMYKLAGRISDTGAPVVFKGALITKLVLAENGYCDVDRNTYDIDVHWIGTPLPTMEKLVETVNQSLSEIRDDLYAKIKREYSENRTAGIVVFDRQREAPYFSMDINTTPVEKSRIYKYDDRDFKGVLPNEILADKIFVLSGHKLFRRSKDIVDAYMLSHCLQI